MLTSIINFSSHFECLRRFLDVLWLSRLIYYNVWNNVAAIYKGRVTKNRPSNVDISFIYTIAMSLLIPKYFKTIKFYISQHITSAQMHTSFTWTKSRYRSHRVHILCQGKNLLFRNSVINTQVLDVGRQSKVLVSWSVCDYEI